MCSQHMNATIYHLTQNLILTPNGDRDLEYWGAKIIRCASLHAIMHLIIQ